MLVVFKYAQTGQNGFIVDSLGSSMSRTTYVLNKFSRWGFQDTRWHYCPSPRQTEIECGPRTIIAMALIITSMSQGQTVQESLTKLNRRVTQCFQSSRCSRKCMQDIVKGRDDVLEQTEHGTVTLNLQTRSPTCKDESKPSQAIYHAQIKNVPTPASPNTRRVRKIASTKTQFNIPRVNSSPLVNYATQKEIVPMILSIVSHHYNTRKDVVFIIYSKTLIPDDILFMKDVEEKKNIHKKDRRKTKKSSENM